MMTLRSTTPVARKPHRCDWCYTTIRPGTRYHRSTNIYDDRVYDWVACAPCSALCPEIWDWCGGPDEGISEDSYAEWAHWHTGRAGADAYLDRRGCTCERCADRNAATRLLEAAVAEAVGMLRTAQPLGRVENMFRQVTRSADLLLRGVQ